jgi:phosphoglycolate phosphatase-like HAD superfamily hydrolase
VTTGALSPSVLEAVRRARALVFDFDGTLVESNEIKWRGFEVAFADFPERLSEIMAYCRQHHHTPRGEKFRHVWEQVLGLRYTVVIDGMLHARFAAATTQQVIDAPERPGALRFLRQVTRSHLTVVLSSTPEDTLTQILAARGWREYFTIVRGAPVDKAAWLRTFPGHHDLRVTDVVFFGDTQEDARAAEAAGCRFVAVGPRGASADGQSVIVDFTELL